MKVTVGVEAGGRMERGALVDGRYRLLSIIGAGGMGVVWRATHETLGYDVALKQIPLEVPGGEARERIYQRTKREARNTGRLRDEEHVIGIIDVLEDSDNVWLVLEYLDCLNLDELVEAAGPRSPAEVAWIGQRVASALAAGHALNIEHRDVKPGNVLIGRDGCTVRLGDYGISRREGDPSVTVLGAVPATLPYAAPEIVREQLTTPESDIWSLAATLYFAVEGRPPFGHHDNQQSLVEAVRSGRVDPMENAGDALGPVLERMLMIDRDIRLDADTVEEKLGRIAGAMSEHAREKLRDHRPVRSENLLLPPVAPKKQINTDPEGRQDSHFFGFRRHFTRRNMVLGIAGVALVSGLIAWGANSRPGGSTAIVETTIPGLPATVGYTAVTTSVERTVDPCSFFGLETLEQFAVVTVAPKSFLNSCEVQVSARGGSISVVLSIYNPKEVGEPRESTERRPIIELGGISIKSMTVEDGCLNILSLSDGREIFLSSRGAQDLGRRDQACDVTDAVTAGVSRTISDGVRPSDLNRLSSTTFGATSACALVDPILFTDLPSRSDPDGFGDWSCQVGGGQGKDLIRIYQRLGDPLSPSAGMIAGRPAQLRIRIQADLGRNGCAVAVEVRTRSLIAPTRNENLYVVSQGPGSVDNQCARAEALATTAITRLPTSN